MQPVFLDRLCASSWVASVAYANLFDPAVPPVFVYEEKKKAQSNSLFYRIEHVVRRVFGFFLFPVTLMCIGARWVHQSMGWYEVPACFKNRKQYAHLAQTWDVRRALLTSWLFTVFLYLGMETTPAPNFTGIKGRLFNPIVESLGAKKAWTGWQYRRFSVRSETQIDALFMTKNYGRTSPQPNRGQQEEKEKAKRVILYCCNYNELAEGKFLDEELLTLAEKMQADVVVYNHPEVGASTGPLTRDALVKAHRAMVRFLEDPQGGGAQEIIEYGYAFGASVQAESLQKHQPRALVRHVAVFNNASARTTDTIASSYFNPRKLLMRLLGWNFDTATALKQLKMPAVILQTAAVSGSCERIEDQNRLIPDAVFESTRGTLAHAVLSEAPKSGAMRSVIGCDVHCGTNLSDAQTTGLAGAIEECFDALKESQFCESGAKTPTASLQEGVSFQESILATVLPQIKLGASTVVAGAGRLASWARTAISERVASFGNQDRY